ncbi:uncharacterized protein LOC111108421 isoform X2 [Crassostrea virginica]
MAVYLYIVFSVFSILTCFSATVTGGTGECGVSQSHPVCCNNYYMVGGTCKACPNGTFGKNCSSQCPTDKYGYLCAETCECKYYEMCSATKGCIPETETRFHGKRLLLWILPFTCGIFILICLLVVLIRRRRGKPTSRSIDDIGHSQNSRIRDASWDSVSQNNTVNNTVNNPERSKPKCTESLAKMCSDDENDTGIYNTLSIRSNYYEEPVGRKKSLVVHQTTKPTYKTMDESFSRNYKKSLVLEKNMAKDENQCEYIDDNSSTSCLGTEKVLFESNLNANQTESPEECINVYNLANFTEPSDSELPPRSTFLKDLTYKLSNLKKY